MYQDSGHDKSERARLARNSDNGNTDDVVSCVAP